MSSINRGYANECDEKRFSIGDEVEGFHIIDLLLVCNTQSNSAETYHIIEL